MHVPLQTPPEHAWATWFEEQTLPQAPQLLTSLETGNSQPSVSLLLLQSAQPVAQAPLQLLIAHVAVTWFMEQVAMQAPQLATSLPVLTSQPLAGSPSQSA